MTLTLQKSATELRLARCYKYFKDIALFLFTCNEDSYGGWERCQILQEL